MKIIIITELILILILTSCLNQSVVELDSAQIREYKGERLDSLNDFFENSILGPQVIDEIGYSLKITGLVKNNLDLSYTDVLENFQNYKKVVTLYCVEGWDVKILWEGVLVKDILNKVKPIDDADTVIFYAKDGYTTSLPLAYLVENDILLAYKMNNVTLPEERGFPFQLVAEDKWGYKWIKWVTEIEVSNDSSYKGYWERRGFSNSANLDEDFR
ncbi:molybdopterin-dependent oxidoreductase [Candidatus Woesearchaeota archaeon]|nr:molybdopterin-dependent oxidoreductase [Candidatus Woesearchaeota archaeon]